MKLKEWRRKIRRGKKTICQLKTRVGGNDESRPPRTIRVEEEEEGEEEYSCFRALSWPSRWFESKVDWIQIVEGTLYYRRDSFWKTDLVSMDWHMLLSLLICTLRFLTRNTKRCARTWHVLSRWERGSSLLGFHLNREILWRNLILEKEKEKEKHRPKFWPPILDVDEAY